MEAPNRLTVYPTQLEVPAHRQAGSRPPARFEQVAPALVGRIRRARTRPETRAGHQKILQRPKAQQKGRFFQGKTILVRDPGQPLDGLKSPLENRLETGAWEEGLPAQVSRRAALRATGPCIACCSEDKRARREPRETPRRSFHRRRTRLSSASSPPANRGHAEPAEIPPARNNLVEILLHSRSRCPILQNRATSSAT